MILKPQLVDLKIVGYYLGKIVVGLGIAMFIPLVLALFLREINPSVDFVISISAAFIFGLALITFCRTEQDPSWMHGMVVSSSAWLVAMFLGALPLILSGHYYSYLDACFEAMSGFATTGLSLTQDLDHMSLAHNLWRHLIMFLGGQGIVVIALSFLVSGGAGSFRMYVGEAREEKILPNVISSARFIWLVSMVYLVLGTSALTFVMTFEGMPFLKALYHGICIFMAGFDTGGFSPQSQNILYYHSFPFEMVTVFLMFMGSINFKLHYAIWLGDKKEIWRNIETVTLFITIIVTFSITALGLRHVNAYPEAYAFFRKGFYHLISGHTGTGYQTIYAVQFIHEWGPLALVGLLGGMMLGGSSCSTTGGIKIIRLGLIFKGIIQDVKRILLSEASVVIKKFHHITDILIDDKIIRSAAMVTICYLGLYGAGTVIGVLCGYPFLDSLFESTSAAANVGLSCGITSADMPVLLKITYIFQMWAGRLEFISVFTLLGFLAAFIKGK